MEALVLSLVAVHCGLAKERAARIEGCASSRPDAESPHFPLDRFGENEYKTGTLMRCARPTEVAAGFFVADR